MVSINPPIPGANIKLIHSDTIEISGTDSNPNQRNTDIVYAIKFSHEIQDIYSQQLGLDTEWSVKINCLPFHATLRAPIQGLMVTELQ